VELSGAIRHNVAVVEGGHRAVDETEQRAAIVLASESASLFAARSFVCSMLDLWDREDPENVVALLTTEIVSNAVRHAVGSVCLELALLRDGNLRVEVRDGCPDAPVVRRSNPGGVGGHGLAIVETLARRWGVERYEDSKVVWFEALVSPRLH
jgi:anti-sigma regulatory factor (Ser/Thr protein kinase)